MVSARANATPLHSPETWSLLIGTRYSTIPRLIDSYPQAKVLGLSATSVRYLDNQRDMAQELFDGNIASEMTLGEAIVRGILPAPRYVTTVFKYHKELEAYEKRIHSAHRSPARQKNEEKLLQALRRALEKADGLHTNFGNRDVW